MNQKLEIDAEQSSEDSSINKIQDLKTWLLRENGILIATGQIDDEVAKNWLSIINSNRERSLFSDEVE